MTADTAHHAIILVDGLRIKSIVGRLRHTARDHAVGKGGQVDPEQHRPELNLAWVTALRARARGVARGEQRQERVPELGGSRHAQEVSHTERRGEEDLWVREERIHASRIIERTTGLKIEIVIVQQAREPEFPLQSSDDKLEHLHAIGPQPEAPDGPQIGLGGSQANEAAALGDDVGTARDAVACAVPGRSPG
jgi:hypothetical protein